MDHVLFSIRNSRRLRVNQFVSSLSMSLSHQASVAAAGANFTCLKRRRLLVRHLQPIYPEVLKQAVLASPSSFASSLFGESELGKFIALSGQSSSLRSHQAMVDLASSAVRWPRSPWRSPARSPRSSSSRSKSPKTPPCLPKRVRFSGTRLPPASSKSSLKKRDFQK